MIEVIKSIPADSIPLELWRAMFLIALMLLALLLGLICMFAKKMWKSSEAHRDSVTKSLEALTKNDIEHGKDILHLQKDVLRIDNTITNRPFVEHNPHKTKRGNGRNN